MDTQGLELEYIDQMNNKEGSYDTLKPTQYRQSPPFAIVFASLIVHNEKPGLQIALRHYITECLTRESIFIRENHHEDITLCSKIFRFSLCKCKKIIPVEILSTNSAKENDFLVMFKYLANHIQHLSKKKKS